MTEHSFEWELDVRWGDFDSLGHVNHAAYATYCEHARLKYLEEVLGVTLEDISTGARGFSLVLANLTVDYRRPISTPDTVTVRLGVTDLGTSSVEMAYELHAEGHIVAEVETTLVAVDPETGGSTPLRDEWVEAIQDFEGEQLRA